MKFFKLVNSNVIKNGVLAGVLFSAPTMAQEVTQEDYGAFVNNNGQSQFQIDFVVERMLAGKPISQASVDAFITIAQSGPSRFGSAFTQQEAQQAAGLLDRYGRSDVASALRESWGAGLASRPNNGFPVNEASEAGSDIGTVENPTGSYSQVEGGHLVIKDPPGGETLRNLIQSCFWRSSVPVEVSKPTGPRIQELTPPGPMVWRHLVEVDPKDGDIIDRYQVSNMIFDASQGQVTQGRFQAYVYAKKIALDRFEDEVLEDGTTTRVSVVYQVYETPSWRRINCATSFLRP